MAAYDKINNPGFKGEFLHTHKTPAGCAVSVCGQLDKEVRALTFFAFKSDDALMRFDNDVSESRCLLQ
jgi:hypothetical protein